MATVSAVLELDDTLFVCVVPAAVKSIVSAAETDKEPQIASTAKQVLRVTFFWLNLFVFFIIVNPPR